MSLAIELQKELQQCSGTENYYRTMFSKLVYTDGIKLLADRAGAYWLIDVIASYQRQCDRDEMLQDFQLWYLVRPDSELIPHLSHAHQNGCIITCWTDTPSTAATPKIRQDVPLTDFPLPDIKLYVRDSVLMLPSEY
jgi:hypothetical protein